MPSTPCVAAKTSVASRPAPAPSQKTRGGRSWARGTAPAAGHAGGRPMITLVWAGERGLSASELNSGEAITTPTPTIAKRGQSLRGGIASLRMVSNAAASAAATSARPRPTNVGSRSSTASRVAGSEKLNASVPRRPYASAACVTRGTAVALLAALMIDGKTDRGAAALEQVLAGAAPGSRLPSVRDLMAAHRAGPATVQRAIASLVARGLVEARPGRGTFVAAARASHVAPDPSWQAVPLGARTIDADALETLLRPPAPGSIVLSSGYLPPDLQPVGGLGAALARGARRPGAWDRVPLEGINGLRAYFAPAGGAAPGDVLICPGGQAALAACFRGLAAPGAPVIFEAPTYLGALTVARAHGLVPVPVPADADGVRPDLLADALGASGARLVYLQPVFANPHGASLAASRRADVLAAVREAGAFLIEDDAFREIALGAAAPPPPLFADDPDGHVVHVRSLTKPSAPGLRIAALVARGPAAARLRAARIVEDLYVAGPLQEAALELVGTPAWRAHLKRLRRALRERRDALAAAWGATGSLPQGGFNLWLPVDVDDRDLAQRAAAAGVIISPGRPFFAAEPPGSFIRLTFASEPPDRLALGAERLRALM